MVESHHADRVRKAMTSTLIRFTRGVPPQQAFRPDELASCAAAVLAKHGAQILQYGGPRGFLPLREQIAGEANVEPARVIVGQGTLQLQDLLARCLLQPGAVAYVEEPTYDRALTVLRRTGARVVGWPLDSEGLDVDAIEARLKAGEHPVLFYVIPDFQNPSGSVLATERRAHLARLAEEYGFWLVEDSPYRRLRYAGDDLPRLFDLAPNHVLQISSFSKLISPGLRVGYVILPETLAATLSRFAEDTYINPSHLNQAVVYEYIRRGRLDPHVEELKALYTPRLWALLNALGEHMAGLATWTRPMGGFFVSAELRTKVKAGRLIEEAQKAGLELTDGRGFFVDGGGDGFVRLPFCALNPDEIETGVKRLAGVVRSLQRDTSDADPGDPPKHRLE
jgi:DNA-binding transcriptional MocR family regulator